MHVASLLDCAAAMFASDREALESRLIEILRPLEAQIENGRLEVHAFRDVVDGPATGPKEIGLAEAQAIDESFEVGDEVGTLADISAWRDVLATVDTSDPTTNWLSTELGWWAVTLPGVALVPLSLQEAASWLGLEQVPEDFAQLMLASRASQRAAADADGSGWPWRHRRLHLMSEAWGNEERDFFQNMVDGGVPAGSSASAWRRGYVPLFQESSGGQLDTLWVVDTRADADTFGQCLNIHLHEPFGHSGLINPGQLFALLRDFDKLLGVDASIDRYPGAAGELYLAQKSGSLLELLEWHYVEH